MTEWNQFASRQLRWTEYKIKKIIITYLSSAVVGPYGEVLAPICQTCTFFWVQQLFAEDIQILHLTQQRFQRRSLNATPILSSTFNISKHSNYIGLHAVAHSIDILRFLSSAFHSWILRTLSLKVFHNYICWSYFNHQRSGLHII